MSTYYDPTINLDEQAQKEENKLVNLALTKLPQPHITGLKLRADIQLGSLVLNQIDSATGVVWVVTNLTGWWDLPDSEFPDLARGWGDGSYDSDGRYAARIITLEGSFLTQDPKQAIAARKKLVEAINSVYSPKDLIVREYTIDGNGAEVAEPKVASVRISGRPQIENVNARGRTNFSIGLKAADPIKYEYYNNPETENYRAVTLTRNSEDIVVTNTGNVKVPVIFRISGSISSSNTATIVQTYGETNTTTKTIYDIYKDFDGALEIDTYNRNMLEIATDGAIFTARKYASSYVDWIYLEPGANEMTFFSPSSDSTCVMYYKSGWLA